MKRKKTGLARALSKLGYCSRSQATGLIRSGHVTLNGQECRDPETPTSPERDIIAVDGHAVEAQGKIYLVMNKPRGIVTTASDEKGRETVYEVLRAARHLGENTAESAPWVAPVGRLDKASEGLLLLTNDSEWGARVTDPETHLEKTYHVQIARFVDERLVESLVRGATTERDEMLRAKRARLLRSGEKNCWLEIVLDEGRNRHIRKMFEALSIEVLRLVRVAIGPLPLGSLAKGGVRSLTEDEKRAIDHALQGRRA
jgi:23S rRNA pseudouridine2605 synthase